MCILFTHFDRSILQAYFMREIMEHRATKISTKDTIKEKDREASLELLKMLEGIKHGIMIRGQDVRSVKDVPPNPD